MKLRCVLGMSFALLVLAAGAPTAEARAAGQRVVAAAPAASAVLPPLPFGGRRVDHGLFSGVGVFRPAGPVRQFAMLLSERDTPDAAERTLLQRMSGAGAMVAFVPLPSFQRRLEAQGGSCTYAAGAFENLAHQLQAFEKLPTYLEPMLVGVDAAGTVAYTLLAQAPAGIFASALSIGFCPRLDSRLPPCAGKVLRWHAVAGTAAGAASGAAIELEPSAQLPAPWVALAAPRDASCAPAAQAFVARSTLAASAAGATPTPAAAAPPPSADTFDQAFARLAATRVALDAPPAQLADLPIVEVLAASDGGARFVVLLSGDGGWAGIDKAIAASFAKQGVPVAGFDSLRYFWSARTPEGLAADLDRLIRFYAARWKRPEVILIGYSQGADVLPFALNRLPARTRGAVRLAALLGPGQKAAFEFHVSHWIGPSGDKPIAPEARRLAAANTLCVYGADERDSLCPELAPQHARVLQLPGGHHFGGDYDALTARIREAAGP